MSRLKLVLVLALGTLAACPQAQAMSAPSPTTSTGSPATSGVGTATGAGAPPASSRAGSATPNVTTTPPTLSRVPSTASQLLPGRGARAAGTAHHGTRVSTLAIVVAALGALLLLACAAWALARRRALEPHWWLVLRHSVAEAGYRVSATWSEFADWVRLGH
jgi:hypothetical protein